LAVVLAHDERVELVADPVHTLDHAVVLCSEASHPDVFVLDVDGGSPSLVIEFLRRVDRSSTGTRVLLILDPDTKRDALLVEYVEAGARGFVDRAGDVNDVVSAVLAAAEGDMFIDPVCLVDLLRRSNEEREAARDAARLLRALTPREFEILRLVVDGLRNDDIARLLHISMRTVATHVQNVFRKLEVHSRIQAVAELNRAGILDELRPTA
jgi:DNA-binding NarL/FixJ family response regulator